MSGLLIHEFGPVVAYRAVQKHPCTSVYLGHHA